MAHETTIIEEETSAATSQADIVAKGHEVQDAKAESADEAGEAQADYDAEVGEPAALRPRMSPVRLSVIAGMAVVLSLGGLTGWLGYRAYESRNAENVHNLLLQVGKQGALNLTTIDWEHAEADVQRIVDSSTGTFRDDFQKRSAPFIEVVKKAKSKSTGHIIEAGVESEAENEAQVLVAVAVNTSNVGAPEQQPKSWRMRIKVQKTGEDEARVSNVEFVP